jgi:hypothetical protein
MEGNWKDKLIMYIWEQIPKIVVGGLILLAIFLFAIGWVVSG